MTGLVWKMELERQEKLFELGTEFFNRYHPEDCRNMLYKSCYGEIITAKDKLTVARYYLGSYELSEMYDALLKEKLVELGCICYNFYLDSLLDNPLLCRKCEYIKLLSDGISNLHGSSANPYITDNCIDVTDGAEIIINNSLYTVGVSNNCSYPTTVADEMNSYSQNKPALNLTVQNQVPDIDLIEPVPENFRKCKCGYKNRGYAVFCARCGKQL